MAEAILLEFAALPGEQLHFKKMLHCTLGERSIIYACVELLPVINTGVMHQLLELYDSLLCVICGCIFIVYVTISAKPT